MVAVGRPWRLAEVAAETSVAPLPKVAILRADDVPNEPMIVQIGANLSGCERTLRGTGLNGPTGSSDQPAASSATRAANAAASASSPTA